MAKITNKFMSIESLVVDTNVNVRLVNNYDVPSMRQSILDEGRIIDPIHIRAIDNVVLRGNRRTWAGQEIVADPNSPQDVVAALKKVAVVVHDVVPGSEEELAIILDIGTQKKLCKTEILLAVWRLDKQFQSEAQIISRLYSALAEYTKNQDKALEAGKIANLKDRAEFLKKWLHGTVGNYMLAAHKMGQYVRDQVELTHLAEDKLLPEGMKVECKMSRDRIAALSAAKTADLDPKKGGEGWSPDTGGKNFNELLEKFRKEDRGEEVGEKKKRPTVKELEDRSNVFKSPAIRSALLVAAGQSEYGKDLMDMDDRLNRLRMVTDTIQKRLPEITNPDVAALLKAIVGNGPAGEVEICLNKFTV